jgi:hypothetical protein
MKPADFKEMLEYGLSHLSMGSYKQPRASCFPTVHSDFKILAYQELHPEGKGDAISIKHNCGSTMRYCHNSMDPIMGKYECGGCNHELKVAALPNIMTVDLQMAYKTTLVETTKDLQEIPGKLVEVFDKNARVAYQTIREMTNTEIIESRAKRLVTLRELRR